VDHTLVTSFLDFKGGVIPTATRVGEGLHPGLRDRCRTGRNVITCATLIIAAADPLALSGRARASSRSGRHLLFAGADKWLY
jgi:hypothetical protein